MWTKHPVEGQNEYDDHCLKTNVDSQFSTKNLLQNVVIMSNDMEDACKCGFYATHHKSTVPMSVTEKSRRRALQGLNAHTLN